MQPLRYRACIAFIDRLRRRWEACAVFRRAVQANAPSYLRPLKGRSHDVMSAYGTFETCRRTLRMSVDRGRPEVIGIPQNDVIGPEQALGQRNL